MFAFQTNLTSKQEFEDGSGANCYLGVSIRGRGVSVSYKFKKIFDFAQIVHTFSLHFRKKCAIIESVKFKNSEQTFRGNGGDLGYVQNQNAFHGKGGAC